MRTRRSHSVLMTPRNSPRCCDIDCRVVAEDFGERADRGQRRAQIVRHHIEEGRLRAVRFLGLLLCRLQVLFPGLALGDVGVGGDEAASRQRRAAYLDHRAVGPHPLEAMRLGLCRQHDARFDEIVYRALAVVAALGVEAKEVGKRPAERTQLGGKVEHFEKVMVPGDQPQLAVEDAESLGQVFESADQQVDSVGLAFFVRCHRSVILLAPIVLAIGRRVSGCSGVLRRAALCRKSPRDDRS